ncbi:hypothetical protein [Shewanella algae]|uniref:hypothetical protein n=1 Tax=Shewanella algae TaxID=38313 RepID=UPI0031F543B1
MWFELYEEFKEASVFADFNLSKIYLDELYGKTEISEIYLRKSKPIDPTKAPELKWPLCEPIPEIENGFAIYLTLEANSDKFLGQLAHEVAHLKNAYAYDLYIEGINTNFAKKLHSHLDREDEWLAWEEHFGAGKDPLYADTYHLIKELEEDIGHDFIKKAFSHLIPTKVNGHKERYFVNLKNWLDEINGITKIKAVNIFKKHQKNILSHKNGEYGQTQTIDEIK